MKRPFHDLREDFSRGVEDRFRRVVVGPVDPEWERMRLELKETHAALEAALAELAAREPATTTALGTDLIADLIRLCHPDRHKADLRELANRITARLLAMRKG